MVFFGAEKKKIMNREDNAYQDGRRAAFRGETLSQNAIAYRNRATLWTLFRLGYMDASKELAKAKKDGGTKNVC